MKEEPAVNEDETMQVIEADDIKNSQDLVF